MTSIPTVGDPFPTLELIGPAGEHTSARGQDLSGIVYFMRTAHCPVCHHHLRHMRRLDVASRTTVIVPGDASDAARVAARHPEFAGRVHASESAHAVLGLSVNAGLQQSGTFVVADGVVVHVKTATIPVGSFDANEALAALRSIDEARL